MLHIAVKVNMLIYYKLQTSENDWPDHAHLWAIVYMKILHSSLLSCVYNLNGLSLNIAKIFNEVLYYKFGHASWRRPLCGRPAH